MHFFSRLMDDEANKSVNEISQCASAESVNDTTVRFECLTTEQMPAVGLDGEAGRLQADGTVPVSACGIT